MQKKFHIITLGCKVNQYESEALREAWLSQGHTELNDAAGADLVLVNSCAITAKAVSDLRAICRRVRKLSPECELLVTGCAAQALPGELEELPVSGLVPQTQKLSLLRWLGNAESTGGENTKTKNFNNESINSENLNGENAGIGFGANAYYGADSALAPGSIDPALNFALIQAAHDSPEAHEDTKAGDIADFWATSTPEEVVAEQKSSFPAFSISDYARSRAVLKIHDGCSQHCTYCIVPQGRGASVSRPWPETIAEAGRLIKAGFREIVLNGVNLRQYGADLNPAEDFWDLVRRIEAVFAPEWAGKGLRFRISSLEPGQLNQKALETLAASRLIAPQLHLSLQSCSPYILKRMGRGHYNPATIPDFLKKLTEIWPVFGLGADFITGFPGEEDEHFEETMRLSAELPLTYAHVFPYSVRPGTAAAKLPRQLPQEVKKERAARLRALVGAKKAAFLQSQLTLTQVNIALEEGASAKQGIFKGVNEFYSDCKFTEPVQSSGKSLIAAKPLRVEHEVLLVQKL